MAAANMAAGARRVALSLAQRAPPTPLRAPTPGTSRAAWRRIARRAATEAAPAAGAAAAATAAAGAAAGACVAAPRRALSVKERRSARRQLRDAPTLREVMRKLLMKTHPDKLLQYPDHARTNQESLARLNSFLDELARDPSQLDEKSDTHLPEATSFSLRFYLLSEKGVPEEKVLHLKHAGGVSRAALTNSLSRFFAACGLPETFRWDEQFFQLMHMDEYRRRFAQPTEEERDASSIVDFFARIRRK